MRLAISVHSQQGQVQLRSLLPKKITIREITGHDPGSLLHVPTVVRLLRQPLHQVTLEVRFAACSCSIVHLHMFGQLMTLVYGWMNEHLEVCLRESALTSWVLKIKTSCGEQICISRYRSGLR